MLKFAAFAALTLITARADAPAPPGKTIGMPIAPMVLEIYSDYECPACKVFHDRMLPSLISDFVTNGKIYLVYRDFPMPMHRYAKQAATYACAAARIGKYVEVGNALFAKQEEWAKSGKVEEAACAALTPPQAQKLRAMVKEPAVASDLQHDMQLGQAMGVNGTPTLVVTHKQKRFPLPSSNNYNLLRQVLSDLLAR
jgi:protein-disulfide isomerase